MGGATGLSQQQLLALDRIGKLPQAKMLNLASGSAIAVHFAHRRSADLDIFSLTLDVDLHAVRASLAMSVPSLVVRGETDLTLTVAADGAIIDFVRDPYTPLEPPRPGPGDVLLASVRDLGAMTPALWKRVRTYFAREAPRLLQEVTRA